ncbi:putative fasciclin-like arabinogalactan protein 20 [Rutidosis leptorrhynchoides]|uniref:putative fasciclin-like arabinogalactan protein 20 n=1 Tax=Rutidosis leptorrhynchoides TaxID=125765 RepID=UPI003A9925B2
MAPNFKFTMIFAAVIFIATFRQATALPSETLANAADTLSNSGYVAMSLTLNLVADVLLSHHNAATIFTPPDSSFADQGQPSLNLLQLHFSPMAFSLSSIRSLPFGTKIPTVDTATFLTVTTPSSSDEISINEVKVIGSPIFDDGSLIVYGIETFFDPNFTVPDSSVPIARLDHCTASFGGDANSNFSFHDGANVLISRGYSVIASFLNLQLLGFQSHPALTIFAPSDEVMVDYSGRFPDYQSLFHRHVLPCKVSWRDLINVDDGTTFDTYLNGFKVKINKSGGSFNVNEISVTFPDMFYSDWIVIHGISDVISVPMPADEVSDDEGDPVDETPDKTSSRMLVTIAPDRSEF